MKQRLIKIYGERNTGSNYLAQLIEQNLDACLLRGIVPNAYARLTFYSEFAIDVYFRLMGYSNLGWKHSIAPSAELLSKMKIGDVVFVTISKNPYSWLLSLYNRPYHRKGSHDSFNDFLTSTWKSVRRENHPTPFENPIIMWNEKNHSYLALGEYATAIHLRYEDLLHDPAACVGTVAKSFDISKKTGKFRNLMESTKELGIKNYTFYRDYYLNERWREKLYDESIYIINRFLNTNLSRRLGYRILNG